MTNRVPITREAAHVAGKRRFYTGVPCKRGHVAERYVSTGGCVQCAIPLKFRRSAFDKRDVPFVTSRLWVRGDYNPQEREGLETYLQQCIDTYDRSVRPNDAPLMRTAPPTTLTVEASKGFEALPGLDTLPSASKEPRGPGRPRNDDRCEHGVDKGFCEVCDE